MVEENKRTRWTGRFFAILQSDEKELKSNLKSLGLDYQKVKGLWADEKIIVWKMEYNYLQFKDIIISLNAKFKQKKFCFGRKLEDKYDVLIYQTEDFDNPQYNIIGEFSVDAKEDNIEFGKLQHNVCSAASKCVKGKYKREQLVNKFFQGGKDEKC